MDNQIKELTLSALFLALACVLSMVQIMIFPAGALSLDFSYVPILIGRRYIGISKTILIGCIFPWFSMIGPNAGGIPGVVFLLLQVLPLIMVDFIFNRKNINISGMLLTIAIMTIYSTLLNNWIINPFYFGWEGYYGDIWTNIKLYLPMALVFNILKLTSVYLIVYLVLPKLIKEQE